METLFETVSPLGEPLILHKRIWTVGEEPGPESLSIVTGLRGDRLTGLYTCMRLAEFLDNVTGGDSEGYRLTGTLQLFPVVHIRALEAGAPTWNFDNLDTDVAFPGSLEGELTEKLCNTLLQHTVRSDYGILLSGPQKWRRETPHIRLTSPAGKRQKFASGIALPTAVLENDDPLNALQITKHWDDCDLNNFTISTGSAQELDRATGDLLFDGLVNLLLATGLLTHSQNRGRKNEMTLYGVDGQHVVTCREAGLFLPETVVGHSVGKGEKLGEVRDVYSGKVKEEIRAPEGGVLLALRDHPLVCTGEAVAWVLTKKYSRWSKLLG